MTRFLKWTDASPEQRAQHLLMVYSNGQGWTTEPPTEPGLYRAFHKSIDGRFKDSAYWEEINKDLEVLIRDYSESIDEYLEVSKKDGCKVYWLGPLLLPEPPRV